MRYKELRRKYITFFSIALLFTIGLVYALLQANLQINGTAKIQSATWDIHFANIQVDSGSVPIGTGDSPATIDTENNCYLSFSTTFELPGDYYRFTFDAVNEGGINARIDSVSAVLSSGGSPVSVPDYLEFYVTTLDGRAVNSGQVIRPGASETYVVYAGFRGEAEMLPSTDTTYSYSISFNFTQTEKNDMGENVSEYHQLRFTESSNIDTRSGLYSTCSSKSGVGYCLYYSAPGYAGKAQSIDLSNNSRTEIKTLSDTIFYTTMYPVSNGFVLAGLNVTNGRAVVTTVDNSFTVIATNNFFLQNYSGTFFSYATINGKYYVMTQGLPVNSHLAFEVSADLQTIAMKDATDLTDTSLYEEVYTYSTAINALITGQSLADIKPFNGGYLIVTSADGLADATQYLRFYRNNQLVWSTEIDEAGAALIFLHGNRIYLQKEDTSNHLTYLDEYSAFGEKLHSTPIATLNTNARFMLNNFMIGEYNGKILMLSYLPGSDPTNYTQWSNYRVLGIEIGYDIMINNNAHGSVTLNKTDAFEGDTVTITITPDTGYSISSITVKDSSNNPVTVTSNQFTMPSSPVTVDIEYALS